MADLYFLTKNLLKLERMGDKSVQNILDAIEQNKKTTLGKFIYALGIRHIGEALGWTAGGAFTYQIDGGNC